MFAFLAFCAGALIIAGITIYVCLPRHILTVRNENDQVSHNPYAASYYDQEDGSDPQQSDPGF